MTVLIGYKKCSTCKRAETGLKNAGVEYIYREIDKQNPTLEEIKSWHKSSGLPLKKFFNTSGNVYREKGLSSTLQDYTEEEQYKLLSDNPMLVKRPILLIDEKVYVGLEVKKYLESIA